MSDPKEGARRYREWTICELKKAQSMREDGMSYSEIGRLLDRKPYSVSRTLRRHGVDCYVPLSHEVREYRDKIRRAVVLQKSGHSYPSIAREIDWSATLSALRKGVVRYAKRNQIPLRKVQQ